MATRVLVIGPSPPPHHGVSVMTRMIVDGLRAIGCETFHVDTADRRGIANIGRLDMDNVLLGLRHTAEIWHKTASLRPHMVWLPISQATFPFLRDALWATGPVLLRRALILHLHGSYLGNFYRNASAPVRLVIQWLSRQATCVLTLSPGAASNFETLVRPQRVRVLPNAVPDLTVSRNHAAEASEGVFRVLYLGNLVRAKGYLDLLAAVPLLRERIATLEVVLAGDCFDGAEEANELMRQHDLWNVVQRPGVVVGAAKENLLARSSLLVFPTYYQLEGQPLVLLEAMAAGLPIVTTAHSCIPETVLEGENALFVPPRNPQMLAEAIITLYQDRERRERMARRSRAIYQQRYRPEVLRENLRKLVREFR